VTVTEVLLLLGLLVGGFGALAPPGGRVDPIRLNLISAATALMAAALLVSGTTPAG
jgi:hypothetical protein